MKKVLGYIIGIILVVLVCLGLWALGVGFATLCINTVLTTLGFHTIGFMDTVSLFMVGIIFRWLFVSNK